MEISITNYRNLSNVGLHIDDGKINYLFGICGSGKSSLLDALSAPAQEADVQVGHSEEEMQVQVNGDSPDYSSTKLFNVVKQGVLFKDGESSDSYEIFIGDEAELEQLEKDYSASIEKLRDILDRLYGFRGRVDDLLSAVKRPSRNGYTAKSPLGKAHAALGASSPTIQSAMHEKGQAYFEWLEKGFTITEDYASGRCPFCHQEIDSERRSQLEELKGITVKDLKPIFKASNLLPGLGLAAPDFTDQAQFEQFKKELVEIFLARDEVDKVIRFVNIAHDSTLVEEGVPRSLEIDPITYKYVPELQPLMQDINVRKNELLSKMGQMRAALKSMVDKNTYVINHELTSLGIPYQFEVSHADRDNHTASYVLKHVNAAGSQDMRDRLSYGEKNLIALLLFLHEEQASVTLIDDPASSYDDFRRSQIYNCIQSQGGRTVLVVSHDQAFVRHAVCETNKKNLGKVLFMHNHGSECQFLPIDKRSFVFLDDEIRRHIEKSSSYYQQMINLRLLADIHKASISKAAWGYVSSILHAKGKAEIETLLSSANTDEPTVLQELSDLAECGLQPMKISYSTNPTADYCDYELLVYARERLRQQMDAGGTNGEAKHLRQLLNDLVHMNDCALNCLNPYVYPVWPENVQAIADEMRQQIGLPAA